MSADTESPRRATGADTLLRFAMLALLLCAFALRAYRLDFQSLWSDEGISLLRAAQSLPDLLRSMPVEHTPGYFVLLHGWLPLAGDDDFALRFLSLLPSVLAVALLFRLGLDLSGRPLAPVTRWVAWAAALLLATSGFQIWYAQEARMYTWLLVTGMLSSWSFWYLLVVPGQAAGESSGQTTHSGWWVLLYALSTATVVYLHLYGALVPVAQAAFAVGWLLVVRNWRGFGLWMLASLAALALFAPWLPHAFGIFAFQGWREGGNAADLPWRYLSAYTISDGMPGDWRSWLPWFYVVLAVGGGWFWWRTRRAAAILLLVLLLVPFVAALALAARNPDYHERYTIFLTVPLLLLAAGGTGLLDLRFWRPARSAWLSLLAPAIVVALLVLANGLALQQLYTNTALHKPDYRSAAARIRAEEQPGDVILVDGPDPAKVFLHYYKGSAPVYAVGELQRAGAEQVAEELRKLTAGAPRVWELLFFHNPAAVQVFLATQAWATEATDHNGPLVTLYGLAGQAPVEQPMGVDFGPALTLEKADVSTLTPRPGDFLRVSTHWFANEQAPEYKFSLRLLDANGEPVQSADYVPQNWFAPTNVWVVGQPATDQRGLVIRSDLPPGTYRLTLRLYDPATGVAVDTPAGQDVTLAELQIGP